MRTRLLLFLAATVIGGRCYATLGEPVASVKQNDAVKLKANYQAGVATDPTSCHQLSSETMSICQYVNSADVVYAVSWNSRIMHPDLTALLGSNYAEYASGVQNQSRLERARHNSQFTTNHLSVSLFYLRPKTHGLIYRTDLVPLGVNPEALK